MSAVSHLKQVIERAKSALKADSCTFYVRDPWWPEDLRLLFMEGVKITEPMYGFLMPLISRDRITKGKHIELIADAQTDWRTTDKNPRPPLSQLIEKKPIFGNFVIRESVRSCARVIFGNPDAPARASLFLNYLTSQSQEQLQELTPTLESLINQVLPQIEPVGEELLKENPVPINRLVRILDTTRDLAAIGESASNPKDILPLFFRKLIQTILTSHGINESEGFGHVNLLNTQADTLDLVAKLPDKVPVPRQQSISGEGVISRVALRARPVLITDLAQSEFKTQEVYIRVIDGIQSELAVPLLAGDNVLGVLNIESGQGHTFTPDDVRLLSYAANHAAIACRLFRQVEAHETLAARTSELLAICRQTLGQPASVFTREEGHESLNRLARLLARWTGADMCDIWGYDPTSDTFWGAGSSPQALDLRMEPRKRGVGVSRYVLDRQMTVWLNDISSEARFKAYRHETHASEQRWSPVSDFPEKVNPVLESLGVKAELGIPIKNPTNTIGVVWLKYKKSLSTEPSPELMDQIDGLIASIALVMELLKHYDETIRLSEENFKKRLAEYSKKLFPKDSLDIPELRLHVCSKPHGGTIGGDFYGFEEVEKQKRVAIMLGDGEGHGIEGALEMLPLYAAFRILFAQTTSTHYVLEKMSQVAVDVKVRGSAVYFMIDFPEPPGQPYWIVSASLAGEQPPLMIFDLHGKVRDFPKRAPGEVQPRLGVGISPPLGEAIEKCRDNDVIVAVTDGILDAGVNEGKKFNDLGVVNAVTGVLQDDADADPKTIANAIYERARSHGSMRDDATVLVVKLGSPKRGRDAPVS